MPVLAALLAVLLFGILAPPAGAAVVWAVGDGAVSGPEDEAVAARIQREGIERLLYLGDVYEHGTAEDFRTNYNPGFGRFKSITSPIMGNHEWANRATGYDPYWGSRAPQTNGGHYYSFDYAGWHFVALNTEEDSGPSSAQVTWLRRDLARYAGTCTIAMMHDPRYSAGSGDRSDPDQEPFWAALSGRAVAVLSGHDHNYQRLKPERGIVQWVVGTGGRGFYDADESDPRLDAVNDETTGALRLVLDRGRAAYEFVTPSGARLDSGALTCRPHAGDAPPPAPTPTPTPPPGGSGSDGGPPPASPAPARARIRLSHPRGGRVYSRRLRRLRGTATVPRDAVLQLTLTRRRNGVCRSWDGRRFRRANCKRPPLVRPAGGSRWALRLTARPPAGRYRLTARIRSSRGVLARAAATFRIR